MKVVVAMDSFKGSLRAPIACEAVRRGILEAIPGAEVALKPMADGGEGTAETVIAAVGGEWVGVGAMGPLPDMRVEAGYARIPRGALVEMAAASGIELLADPDRNPLRTTTFGTGELLAAAAARGARHPWPAIGGSATPDRGTDRKSLV